MNQQIIIRPLITEKSMQTIQKGAYVFEVVRTASKHQIEQAINTLFGVAVQQVRTVYLHGKQKRVGKRRQIITTAGRKKAFVTLLPGQKIDLFPSAPKEQTT
ncbi:50S ribosomal protein L23 [Candidatus Roizmanbacteria bacterium]|nr:50S ribosomal protein L23 [Candidatus Roizmanbacteria bacterium]